jgi:Tfp pilus assembly protein PilF
MRPRRSPSPGSIAVLKAALRLAGLCLVAFPLDAQQAPDRVALGIVATEARDLPTALQHFEAALKQDPSNYEANWRAALTLGLLGDPFPMKV